MLKEFKDQMIEAGMEDIYNVTMQQVFDMMALTDEGFKKVLDEKVLYTLKAEQLGSKMDAEFILRAVEAHENYALYLKRNTALLEKCLVKVLKTDLAA